MLTALVLLSHGFLCFAATDLGNVPSLTVLPKLPIRHHSWPLYEDNNYDSNDDNFLQYVRIIGTCPVRLDFSEDPNDSRYQQLFACVRAARLFNATITVNYSPYANFYFNQCNRTHPCPAPSNADIQQEAGWITGYLDKLRLHINAANEQAQTCVQISHFFLDQETWGYLPGTMTQVKAASDSTYDLIHLKFPESEIIWYARGAIEKYPFCPLNQSNCWVDNDLDLVAKGHNVATSMYLGGCMDSTEALWTRNVVQTAALTPNDGFSRMVFAPHIALGCGWAQLENGSCTHNYGVWNWTWNYSTSFSFAVGSGVNGQSGAPWATTVALAPFLYPSPLNTRTDKVATPLGDIRSTWAHFIAYVMGAHSIMNFPTTNVSSYTIIPRCPGSTNAPTPKNSASTLEFSHFMPVVAIGIFLL